MVALGWLLIIIGFGIESNKEVALIPGFIITLGAGGSIRYSWWMVILVTPGMLIMAVAQAAIDNNRLAMNIIGAIVSFYIITFSALASETIVKTLTCMVHNP